MSMTQRPFSRASFDSCRVRVPAEKKSDPFRETCSAGFPLNGYGIVAYCSGDSLWTWAMLMRSFESLGFKRLGYFREI